MAGIVSVLRMEVGHCDDGEGYVARYMLGQCGLVACIEETQHML
jgi:hypothetical protein